MDKHLISFVASDKNRPNLLDLLSKEESLTASQISKKLNYTYLTHIIRTLKDLTKKTLLSV